MKKNIKFLNGLLFLIMFIVFNILQVNAAHVAGSGGGARRINLGEKYGELEAFSVIYGGGERCRGEDCKSFKRISKLLINKNPALCIDSEKFAKYGITYIRTGVATGKAKTAYGIIYNDRGNRNNQYYMIAQIFLHGNTYVNTQTGLKTALEDYYYYFLGYSKKSAEELAIINAPALWNVAQTTPTPYVWESRCSENDQSFVSSYEGKECVGDDCNFDCTGTVKECPPDDPDCNEGPEGPKCPDPNAHLAGYCEVNSRFDDPGATVELAGYEDWSCIAGYPDYLLDTLNNRYCEVYCQEHVTTEFPGGGDTFVAGRYFAIGYPTSGNIRHDYIYAPIRFIGTRNCKVYHKEGSKLAEGVGTEKFVKEYTAAAERLPQEYTDWRNEIRRSEAIARTQKIPVTASNVGSYMHLEGSCFNKTYHTEYRDEVQEGEWTQCYCWPEPANGQCPCGTIYEWYKTGKDTTVKVPYDVENDKSQWDYGKTYIAPFSYLKYNVDGSSRWVTEGGNCGTYTSDPNAKLAKYRATGNQLEGMRKDFQLCVEAGDKYDFMPTVTVEYDPGSEYPDNYKYSGTLTTPDSAYQEPTLRNGTNQKNTRGTGAGYTKCVGAGCEIWEYVCTADTYCPRGSNQKSYYFDGLGQANVTNIQSVGRAYINYANEDGGGRYVSKANGYTSPSPLPGMSIDLGAMVIPLHFQMAPGTYEIKLSYSNVGHKGRFDEFMTVSDTAGNNPYTCVFNLTNDLFCNPNVPPGCDPNSGTPGGGGGLIKGGIDVIYRTIELKERKIAFPSVNGDGRTPGPNWAATNTEIHHACSTPKPDGYTDVYQYITCNRGVAGNALYNEEPIYEINLTPTLIKKIREYNKSRLRAHGNPGYGDFTLTCNENGRACVAKFIHETFKDEITGTCTRRNEGNVAIQKDEKLFNACRYRN